MGMGDPVPQFRYLVQQLKKLRLAYLHVIEARVSGPFDQPSDESVDFLVDEWDNTSPVLLAGG
jgi:NADPH2 dehydrogenase